MPAPQHSLEDFYISRTLIKVHLSLQTGPFTTQRPAAQNGHRYIKMLVPLYLPSFLPHKIGSTLVKAIGDMLQHNDYEICDRARAAGINPTFNTQEENDAGLFQPCMRLGFLFEGSSECLRITRSAGDDGGRYSREMMTGLEWGEKTRWRDAFDVQIRFRELEDEVKPEIQDELL